MKLKCTLESHYHVPNPILSLLMGRLPQVSSSNEDISSKSDIKDDQGKWIDRTARPGTSHSDRTVTSSPPLPSLNEPYLVSTSASGRYLVLARKKKFFLLQLNEKEGEYIAASQGSGCVTPDETITAILCLPLCASSRRSEIFVMVGYSTGWIRIFSEKGVLVTAQLLEQASILSIKLRTPPSVLKISSRIRTNEDEEITVLFQGNKVISIVGQDLWTILKACDDKRQSSPSGLQVSFKYKKWEFSQQEKVLDAVSLGPSPEQERIGILNDCSTISTHAFPTMATSRYVAVGTSPMLCYYSTSDDSRLLVSAVSMAGYVMARLATPMFVRAKAATAWLTGSNSPSSRPTSPVPYAPDLLNPPSQIEAATPIPAVLQTSDPGRRIMHISLCPPAVSAQRHTLAATSDALGRVILWDVLEGEMVRMWKGVRDAVCGWVEVMDRGRILLFLVIYAARRGVLKVFQMRHGHQVGTFPLGTGWQLVPCGREPLGSSMVSIKCRKMAMKEGYNECGDLAKCLLIGPEGEVLNVAIKIQDS
ncbi:Rab3 GTPase-activating protein non-catalytic subunit [Apophysomyces ossiformis]|uniref:Rab3 GTPase-activating protein non-catalytic subunit n=1 Tax=Apophysomyces ossiformis TaxID=679940 RepID=A0A8H7BTZ1_9FUNG|nr:Rab3 GTPase-activating protein non-catalytic subunit [Apophysomyces ossiformis]